MKRILIIALCFLAFTKANSQNQIQLVDITKNVVTLTVNNVFAKSLVVTEFEYNATRGSFIVRGYGNEYYITHTPTTTYSINGTLTSITNPLHFRDTISKFIVLYGYTSSAAGSSPLPVGGATSVLQQTQIDTATATNAILRLQDSSTQSRKVVSIDNLDSLAIRRLQQTNIDSIATVINQLKINNDTTIIANIERRLQTTKLTEANAKLVDIETELQGIKANQTNKTQHTKIVDANGNVISDFAKDEKLDTIITRLPNATTTLNGATKGVLVRQIQVTPFVGTTIPTVTAYNTNANTVVTTNCTEIVLENMSTTTNATFVYGGQTFILGFKGNGVTPSFYNFKAPYNESSFKYSPFATLIVNAASSSVLVTKYFIQ